MGDCIMFLFVVIASCVSGKLVYVLLKFRMSLHCLEGLVTYETMLRKCLHVSCCSCRILSCIYLFSVYMRVIISGVWCWCLRCSLVRILCLMFLLNPGPNCEIAPVGIYCLLLCVIMLFNSLISYYI